MEMRFNLSQKYYTDEYIYSFNKPTDWKKLKGKVNEKQAGISGTDCQMPRIVFALHQSGDNVKIEYRKRKGYIQIAFKTK